MSCIEIFEDDIVDVRFDWTTSAGDIKDVTGGTLICRAEKRGTGTRVALSPSIANAALGRTTVEVTGADLSVGQWNVQMRLTLGDDVQTAEQAILVKRSIPAP